MRRRDALLDEAYEIQKEIRLRIQIRPRERETAQQTRVLHLVRGGLSNKEIASQLNISMGTVKFHVRNLLDKYNCKYREEL